MEHITLAPRWRGRGEEKGGWRPDWKGGGGSEKVNYYPIRDLNSQTSYPESGQVTSVLRSRFVPHSAMAVCFIVFVGSVDFIIAFFSLKKK